jgi:gas vesicle protein
MISGKVVIGALSGIVAGAVIGILLAPDKGSESRNKMIKKSEDYLDSVKGKFNTLLDSMAGKFNGGKADISDAADSRKKEAKKDLQPLAG